MSVNAVANLDKGQTAHLAFNFLNAERLAEEQHEQRAAGRPPEANEACKRGEPGDGRDDRGSRRAELCPVWNRSPVLHRQLARAGLESTPRPSCARATSSGRAPRSRHLSNCW